MILNSPTISGSLTVTGNIITSGSITISGSIASASYATNAELLDGLDSTAFATTGAYSATSASLYATSASLSATSGSLSATSGSLSATSGSLSATSGSLSTASGSFDTRVATIESKYATTGSNTFTSTQVVSGSILQSGSFTTTGTIIAQTINVQTVTSSVVYSSGSNVFGNSLGNSQTFTGSVLITGSLTIAGASSATSYSGTTIYGSTVACSPIGLFSGCVGIGTANPSAKLHINGGRTLAITGNENYSLGIGRESNTNAYYLGVHSTSSPNLLFSNNAGTTNMTLDYSGNLGLGVTPSAWSGITALQIGGYASFGGDSSFVTYVSSNAYYNAGWKYIGVSAAANYYQVDGAHYFRSTSTTGTAGGDITWITPLSIASTGAATFSSSVTATSGVFSESQNADTAVIIRNSNTGTASQATLKFGNSNGDAVGRIGSLGANFTSSGPLESDGFYIQSQRQTLTLSADNNKDIRFWNGASQSMVIKYGGNIGIGTCSPSVKLEVVGGTINNQIARFITADFPTHSIGLGVDGAGAEWGASIFQDDVKRFTIDGNGGILVGSAYQASNAPANGAIIEGNVGIGTSSPSATLHIVSPVVSAGTALKVVSDGNSNDKVFEFTGADGVASQSMYMFQSGNVGIGTCVPSQQLSFGMLTNSATRTYTTDNQGTLSFYNLTTGNLEAYLDIASVRTGNDSTLGGANIRFLTQTVCSTTSACERMRITSGGNVGIGTASPVTANLVGSTTIVKSYNGDSPTSTTAQTYYINQSNLYLFGRNAGLTMVGNTNEESVIAFGNPYAYYVGGIRYGMGSGPAAGDMVFQTCGTCERMRITSGGNVGIGTSSPTNKLQIGTMTVPYSGNEFAIGNGTVDYAIDVSATSVDMYSSAAMSFATSTTERMRITSGGGVVIGATSDGGMKLRVISPSLAQGNVLFATDNNIYNSIQVYSAGADGYNAAATVMIMGRNTTNSRSINAGGSINASGADYAEYMTKAIEDNIAKGDVVGVNQNGLLTNIFTDAKSFVVKSTDPSYVGGDTWGNIDDIGKLPLDATDEQKAEHEAKIESARAKVDRIAFSGQVPCNVLGANVGDYIIPINDNGKIKGQAITNPTFEQYQISVGKVWKIMEDGRAWIAVKIG